MSNYQHTLRILQRYKSGQERPSENEAHWIHIRAFDPVKRTNVQQQLDYLIAYYTNQMILEKLTQ